MVMAPTAVPEVIPAAPGAYVLLIRLDRQLPVEIKRFSGVFLEPGRYAYCGSAKGPGGLRARVGRHLSAAKTMRWHIDRLTAGGTAYALHTETGGEECDLVRLLTARGATAPITGFGSSDCRRCRAHLLSIPRDFEWPFHKAPIELGRAGDGPL